MNNLIRIVLDNMISNHESPNLASDDNARYRILNSRDMSGLRRKVCNETEQSIQELQW